MTSEATLRAQIGQLIVVRASGHLCDRQIRYPAWEAPEAQLRPWLGDLNLGGVILLGGSPAELALRTRQLQGWAQTPLLIAADIEEGVGHRFPGATWFPPPLALRALGDRAAARTYARIMGATTAREALALGINWVLAPVVDVNNNPENPVINVRAFGETPPEVCELAIAFLQGCQDYPVLTTAKHFPGHGDTATDSHLELPTLPHTAARLEAVELAPFRAAIAAGVDTVMTAHLLVPAWDAQHPATLSSALLTGLLRDRLGFSGLIVTDALIMGGLASSGPPTELCVQALAAGADVLLMPPDPAAAITAILAAVQSGRLAAARIQAAWERVQAAKAKLAQPPAPALTPATLELFSATDGDEAARAILRGSQQQGGRLPLARAATDPPGINLMVVSSGLNHPGLAGPASPAIAIPRRYGFEPQLWEQSQLYSWKSSPGQVLLQIFMRGDPFRGQAGLNIAAQTMFKSLLRQGQLVAIAVYGSPYVQAWFRQHSPPEIPWVFTYGQMPDAQQIALATLWGSPTAASDGVDRVFI